MLYHDDEELIRQKVRRRIEIERLIRKAECYGLHLMTGEKLRQQIIVEAVRRDFGGVE